MNEDQNNFLAHWFQGFGSGLDQLDQPAREKLLSACGLACAQSYTLKVFQEAWHNAANMQDFLQNLAQQFPEATYSLTDEHTIEVIYRTCACDLVLKGWISTPHLCRCSAANLQANFSSVLGSRVRVQMLSSILHGDNVCSFEVSC